MAENKTGMLQGFREFIMRGNVIDLAVAVVVGAAFAAVVKSFADYIINPILAAFGGVDAAGLGFQLTDNPNTFVDLGAVITAIITFLITMAVVYFIFVMPMNKMRERTAKPTAEEAAATEVDLLTEIRDLLAEQRNNRPQLSFPTRPPAAPDDSRACPRRGEGERQPAAGLRAGDGQGLCPAGREYDQRRGSLLGRSGSEEACVFVGGSGHGEHKHCLGNHACNGDRREGPQRIAGAARREDVDALTGLEQGRRPRIREADRHRRRPIGHAPRARPLRRNQSHGRDRLAPGHRGADQLAHERGRIGNGARWQDSLRHRGRRQVAGLQARAHGEVTRRHHDVDRPGRCGLQGQAEHEDRRAGRQSGEQPAVPAQHASPSIPVR